MSDQVAEKEVMDEKDVKQYNRQLIIFKLGNEEYGLEIDSIKEVVLTPTITNIPHTPEYIKGVANVRGNVIAILDLEQKFGMVKNENDQPIGQYTLVVESEEYNMGILVQQVPDTLSASDSDIDHNVNIIHDTSVEENYIQGIVKIEERLIILIDIFKVMNADEIKKLVS